MSLAEKYPQLINEFIYEKNPGLKPDELMPNSNKRVWWRCKEGHEYITKICHRTASQSNCPYCSGRKLTPEKSLAVCNPALADEFHPMKNGSVTPADIFNSSGKSYWWQCTVEAQHEWKTSVDNRRRGTGCPYCSGKKTLLNDSFAKKHPELLEECDYTLNKADPLTLPVKSNMKAHWKCKKKNYHLWSTTIARRTDGTSCPYCVGQKLHENDSAFYGIPEPIINDFDQSLNPLIDLKTINIKFPTAITWKCAANPDHKPWKACISSRMQDKSNCPECNPHMIKDYKKSLAYLYPEIAEEWHPENILTASQVSPGSGKKVKWKCLFRPHHVYEARVAQRVKGHRCPNCQNAPTLPELRLFSELSAYFKPSLHHKIGTNTIDLYINEINVAIEWDSYYYHLDRLESDIKKSESLLKLGIKVIRIRNERLDEIPLNDVKLKILLTKKDDLDFSLFKDILRAIIEIDSTQTALIRKALSLDDFVNIDLYNAVRLDRGRQLVIDSLDETHPDVAQYWHPTKNQLIRPADAAAYSHEAYWWLCGKCNMEWNEKVVNVSTRKGICSYCSKKRAGPDYNLLSFYPHIAAELVDVDPTQITPYSGQKLKWKCSKCSYLWESIVNNRTGKKQGCPQCIGKLISADNSVGNSLEAVQAWDYTKNSKKPEEVFANTHDKHFFICNCGTSIQKRPRDFILRNQRRCSACVLAAKKNKFKVTEK
jgi:very-short-patch-repair endonuclease